MTRRTSIVVGYSPAAVKSLQALFPEHSIVLVEEPDVIRKRGIQHLIEGYSVIAELVPYAYQLEDAADAFLATVTGMPIASVVPITEYATPFAARLADLLHLPGAGHEASVTLRNKHRLRDVTRAHGVRNPVSLVVTDFEDVEAFAAHRNGPVIIKPANRQGSVGTVIVRDHAELREAWQASRLRDEGVMVPDRDFPDVTLVEEFITGSEHSVEALVENGVMLFSNVTQKELFDGPHPVERGHTVPAPMTAATAGLVAETQRVIDATGFKTGIIHCEWLVNDDGAYLVECAGRFAGDGIIDLIERAYAFDIVDMYHRLMRGETLPKLPVTAAKTAMVRFLGGQDATIEGVHLDAAALNAPGVAHYHVTAKPGDRVYAPTMSWHRLGAVTVEAHDPEAALALAERALEGIRVTYAPSAAPATAARGMPA